MRKIYFLLLTTLFCGTLNAQLVNLNGNVQIHTESAAIFFVDGDIHINGTSTITNNGQFESTGQLELNNTSIFTNAGAGSTLVNSLNLNSGTLSNQSTDSFNVLNNADLGGGLVTNNSGAMMTVGGATNMNVSTVTNTGAFRSNIFNINAGALFQNDNGLLQVENSINPTNAGNLDTDLGTIEFVGTDATKRLNIGGIVTQFNVQNLIFNADNPTNNIILESSINVSDTADFNSGIVQYDNPLVDSLVILSGGLVTVDSINENSYMADALYRYPGSVGEFMRFPVGDASGNYRPFWIKGAQFSGLPPLIAVDYLGARTITNNDVVGYNANYNTNSWGFSILENTLDPSIVQVQYATADGVNQTESIIAEGFEIVAGDTIYFNLGQGPNSSTIGSGGVVESLVPAQGNSVVMIGQSTELKFRMRVFLEGAITSGITMGVDPVFRDTIRNIYEFGGTTSKPMLAGKIVPATAIDSFKIYLRSGVNGPYVDSTSAWLMSDGTVRDYVTGDSSYAIFTNATAAAGPYYAVIKHRNHLTVQSAFSLALTNVPAPIPYNFGQPGDIYGGGGYKMIGATAVIAAGNSNEDGEVNSLDYSEVLNDQTSLLQGYNNTDVLFSASPGAEVNVDDLNKVNENSSILYFSTVP